MGDGLRANASTKVAGGGLGSTWALNSVFHTQAV